MNNKNLTEESRKYMQLVLKTFLTSLEQLTDILNCDSKAYTMVNSSTESMNDFYEPLVLLVEGVVDKVEELSKKHDTGVKEVEEWIEK